MSIRRLLIPLVLAVTASACSGDDEPRSAPDDPTSTQAAAEDGTDDAPTISGAPPATIVGQPAGETIDEPTDETVAPETGTPDDDRPPADTAPRETVAPQGEIARVISLAPTHTETIFAIGADPLLIAVDPDSDFPPAAIELQDRALRPSTGDTTAIEALQPDLVIIGDDPTDLAGRLGAIGIPAWRASQPHSIADAYDQIRALGDLLGADDAAGALVAEMQDELAAIRAELPESGTLTYFHENDPGFITPAAGSFIDLVYGELGLRPIATSGEERAGFVQSSSDEIVAGDPCVIVLADIDCCAVTAAIAAGRPGWATISAIRTGAVAEVPDAITQRWGPRLVVWWRLVADAAASATSTDAG